jgi:4-amino-4-deoxy-L-arabinose transferase-like glycosyltransferase
MGLLPVLVAGAWLVTGEGARGLRRLISPLGVLTFVLVSAFWLLPFLFAGSRSYAQSVVWEDWLAWYLGVPQVHKILNVFLEAAEGLIPWTLLLALPLLAVRRQWRDGAFRLVFLAWIVPFIVVTLSHNHRARYLLPTYPAALLMVAWWADRHATERSRALFVVAVACLAGALVALAVLALPWVDPAQRALVDGFWWKAGFVAAGGLVLAVYACWALLARRPTPLIAGVTLGMAVLLSGGLVVYNGWINRGQDYPALAALVERHASGGNVGITGGRFFSIDFYLGRGLTPVRTVAAFDEWMARPDRPVSVITGRQWSLIQGRVRPDVEVLATMRVRRHVMYILRRSDPDTARARQAGPGSASPRSLR